MRNDTASELGLFDKSSETAVLSAILRSEEKALVLLGVLGEQDVNIFGELPEQLIYEAACGLRERGQPVTAASVVSETRVAAGRRRLKTVNIVTEKMIENLLAIRSGEDALAHIAPLRTLRDLRLYSKDLEVLIGMFADKRPIPEIVPKLVGLVAAMTADHNENPRLIMGYDTPGFIDEKLTEAKAGKIKIFPWPWESWEWINPMAESLMTYFCAPDGHGKSAMAEYVADYWARECGFKVVYIHTEYNPWFMQCRRLTHMTGIPTIRIVSNSLSLEEDKLIDAAKMEIRETYGGLHFLHASGRTSKDIIGDVWQLVNSGEANVFVLDYFQDLDATNSRDLRNEKHEKDAVAIQHALSQMNVAALVLVQGNKDILTGNGGTMTRKMMDMSQKAISKGQLTVMMARPELDCDGGDTYVTHDGLIAGRGRKGGLSSLIKFKVDKQTLGDGGEGWLWMTKNGVVTDVPRRLAESMNYNYWD